MYTFKLLKIFYSP